MIKLLTGTALAVMVMAGAATDADAFERKRVTTGTYGNQSTFNSSAGCAGGTCSRSATRTGPAGNAVVHGGSVNCANGVCNTSRSTKGTRGRSVSSSGSITR
ncbi:hypothetical protein RDV64_05730 [Acuticoccus sp. MNP-M23]|uniref:hypothetical protein n=1 Tax=Acuticoccus sp. MNP-M23 TaxID=3072793 RepID=UPI0028162A91|nr:hypothetical protein [Acuticoccus sp. MNP-M23]WMS43890.1 hypothetical protein RDV64_05730 [Acuticoccus sp. MNP-M23]